MNLSTNNAIYDSNFTKDHHNSHCSEHFCLNFYQMRKPIHCGGVFFCLLLPKCRRFKFNQFTTLSSTLKFLLCFIKISISLIPSLSFMLKASQKWEKWNFYAIFISMILHLKHTSYSEKKIRLIRSREWSGKRINNGRIPLLRKCPGAAYFSLFLWNSI